MALKNFFLHLKQLLVLSDLYEMCTRQWNERIDNVIDNYVKIVRSIKLANTIFTKAGRDLVSGS